MSSWSVVVLSAAEVRAALDALGLSQVAAARLFDVDARTMRRWVADGIDSGPALLAFRALMLLPASKREGVLSRR